MGLGLFSPRFIPEGFLPEKIGVIDLDLSKTTMINSPELQLGEKKSATTFWALADLFNFVQHLV
ncbi:MAG: hypothetical protein GQ561_05315 [Calditrichae bacterium]|nr:hypothetical protein [Calditrichia bacterium]